MTSRAALIPAALLAFAGCESKTGPAMKIVVAQGATNGRCNSEAVDTTVPTSGISQLRLSVLRRTGNTRTFVCDRVFQVPKEQPHLKLPIGAMGDAFDIVAEGFAKQNDASFQRKATGQLLAVDPADKTVKELDDLRMLPTETASCANNPLSIGRAFHSATKLPNGQVLVVGGTIASATNPMQEDAVGDTFQLAGTAELYDPKTGRFTSITEATPPKARAFHQAFLLNETPPYRVLVVGGVTIDDPTKPALGLGGLVPGPRLVPVDQTFVAFTSKAAGAEILTYDPTARTLSREPVTGFTPALFQAGGAFAGGGMVSDGVDFAQTAAIGAVKQSAALHQGEVAPRTGTSVVPRYGATLSPLHDGSQLLWGGNYDVMNTPEPIGEYLAGAGGTGSITRTTASVAGEVGTAFHTATVFASDATSTKIVFTGGFTFSSNGVALQTIAVNEAVREVDYATGASVVSSPLEAEFYKGFSFDPTCTAADRYRPAGWESAVAIGRSRVLVSGGTPTQVMGPTGCHDCPDGETSYFCALQQMAIFDGAAHTLNKFASLAVGRFGHTTTVLDDGTALVIGGINSSAGVARVLKDAEIINPRTLVPPTGTDADDPIADELEAAGLVRVPGASATLPTSADKPSNVCSLL